MGGGGPLGMGVGRAKDGLRALLGMVLGGGRLVLGRLGRKDKA